MSRFHWPFDAALRAIDGHLPFGAFEQSTCGTFRLCGKKPLLDAWIATKLPNSRTPNFLQYCGVHAAFNWMSMLRIRLLSRMVLLLLETASNEALPPPLLPSDSFGNRSIRNMNTRRISVTLEYRNVWYPMSPRNPTDCKEQNGRYEWLGPNWNRQLTVQASANDAVTPYRCAIPRMRQ